MTPISSDDKLQVERTILSWVRTMFVSAIVTLVLFKLSTLYPTPAVIVSFLLAFMVLYFTYYAGQKVATSPILKKAQRHVVISVGLSSSIFLYGVSIVLR